MKTDVYEQESSTATRSRGRDKSGASKSDGDQAEMMKKMEAAGRPGPAHHTLNALVGEWNAEVKCWKDPGESPEVTEGTAETRWILSGRFLEEEFHGQMMGKPFTGLYLMGFDNTKQTFTSAWMSDTQTSMFVSEGKGDNGNKIITMEGKVSCAATGRKDIPMKTVLRLISPDKHIFEMFDGSQGNAKTMEITYTQQ